ncbi:aspartate/glutamate racemase family protein [Hutsoniella sourekii]|uniref:aspartate/glutamate racemase family protein n=1 Tax=Hutsoniella sourekii TaxID=87650 RepID=UPI0004891EFD|nr:aspartate/glutamate racemase family protein [Hutsoniella sourekii]
MKVAVFAGTPVDTHMGIQSINKLGYEGLSYPLAETPQEQTRLQYESADYLAERFKQAVINSRLAGAEAYFLNCNSLSSAIDYHAIAHELQVEIISPLDIYHDLAKQAGNFLVLAANGISAYQVDRILTREYPGRRNVTLGHLALVEAIEAGIDPDQIIEDLGLKSLIQSYSQLQVPAYQLGAILLACTHFPYMKEALQRVSPLPIIDPLDYMLDRINPPHRH